ncbi:hypothetical protein OSTOST_14903 [Ostertagia ostertagi]
MSGIKSPACNANADELPAAIAEAYRTSVDSATNGMPLSYGRKPKRFRRTFQLKYSVEYRFGDFTQRVCGNSFFDGLFPCVICALSSENNDIAAEELLHYQSTSQSRAPTRPWLLQAVMRTVAQSDEISLEQLGEAMSHFDIGEEYNVCTF